MSRPAIVVDGLSKSYRLGVEEARPDSLREAVTHALTSPFRRFRDLKGSGPDGRESFWALKDVSFEVRPGEVIGVIGRNGAGKSTLLKILSRIVEPTEGSIRYRGRMASLLEVGTGFHPELTGRENIFLNGSILGMKHAEIQRRFDEIVDFSGVEKFLDTPVKRYSSGMYIRLAFAVAAHLEPEILIVDEVLAVGDAEFQRKCLGKMKEVSHGGGRTVLFVSHNIPSVRSLCDRGVYLRDGRVVTDGPTETAVEAYLGSLGATGTTQAFWERVDAPSESAKIYIREISVQDGRGQVKAISSTEDPIEVQIRVHAREDVEHAQIAIRVSNDEGVAVFTTATSDRIGSRQVVNAGEHTYRVTIPDRFLSPGRYNLIVVAHIPHRICFDVVEELVRFAIEDIDPDAARLRDGRLGVVTPMFDWCEVGA